MLLYLNSSVFGPQPCLWLLLEQTFQKVPKLQADIRRDIWAAKLDLIEKFRPALAVERRESNDHFIDEGA